MYRFNSDGSVRRPLSPGNRAARTNLCAPNTFPFDACMEKDFQRITASHTSTWISVKNCSWRSSFKDWRKLLITDEVPMDSASAVVTTADALHMFVFRVSSKCSYRCETATAYERQTCTFRNAPIRCSRRRFSYQCTLRRGWGTAAWKLRVDGLDKHMALTRLLIWPNYGDLKSHTKF